MEVNKKTPSEVKSFFDITNICFEKKQIPSDEIINKHTNQFMINQHISCDMVLTTLAHELSKMKITNKMYFDCLYYGLPKSKRFIKYNASKAKKEQDIQYLMEYFNCSQQTAKEYIQIIDENELQKIRDYNLKRGLA